MKSFMIPYFTLPKYFERLSIDDQCRYMQLREDISKSFLQSKNAKICDNFQNVFDLIRGYVNREPSSENDRALVCGIMWVDDKIIINTRQLQLVIGKCKSSINNGIQTIGYVSMPTSADIAVVIGRRFPFLKNSFAELRQWTVRRLSVSHQLPPPPPPPLPAVEHHFDANVFEFLGNDSLQVFDFQPLPNFCVSAFDPFQLD